MLYASNYDVTLFEDWLKDKGSIKDGTIYLYRGSVEKFLISNPDLDNLDDYNNFLVEMTIKKRCTHYFSALKHFIEFKISGRDAQEKLIKGLLRPKRRFDYKLERKYLPAEKLFEVLNYLDDEKHRIVALIQILTGARVGDILRLIRGHIEADIYEGKQVLKLTIIGKGDRRHIVFIHDPIAQKFIWNYIFNHVNYDKYYFITLGDYGKRIGDTQNEFMLVKMNYQWYWLDLKQALQTAGVDRKLFASHDFRRCFARRVWTKYKDIYILQKLLNHQDPKVTVKYLEQSGLHIIDYQKEVQDLSDN